MSILYAISIVYIAGEYCDPPCCTPIGILEVFNGWHICGNLLEFVDQQLEKWNNKTNRLCLYL